MINKFSLSKTIEGLTHPVCASTIVYIVAIMGCKINLLLPVEAANTVLMLGVLSLFVSPIIIQIIMRLLARKGELKKLLPYVSRVVLLIGFVMLALFFYKFKGVMWGFNVLFQSLALGFLAYLVLLKTNIRLMGSVVILVIAYCFFLRIDSISELFNLYRALLLTPIAIGVVGSLRLYVDRSHILDFIASVALGIATSFPLILY